MNSTPEPLEGIILSPDPMAQLVDIHEKEARPLDLFTSPGVVEALVARIREAATQGFQPDLSTDKGRKEIASRAYRVARAKTALDDLGKAEVARLKELPKAIDSGRKALRDGLDALAEEIRRPLTAWEEQRTRLKAEISAVQNLPARLMSCSSALLLREVAALEGWNTAPEHWAELAGEAQAVKAVTLLTLREMAEKAKKAEEERAELERLRQEKAERERKEREEALRREGEERARAQAAQQGLAPAPDSRPEAQAPALQTPADRQAQPPLALADYSRPVAALPPGPLPPRDGADLEHRRTFNREALADMITALNAFHRETPQAATTAEGEATAVLRAIATGKVRHVSISY